MGKKGAPTRALTQPPPRGSKNGHWPTPPDGGVAQGRFFEIQKPFGSGWRFFVKRFLVAHATIRLSTQLTRPRFWFALSSPKKVVILDRPTPCRAPLMSLPHAGEGNGAGPEPTLTAEFCAEGGVPSDLLRGSSSPRGTTAGRSETGLEILVGA
jgi:hypothetical protein